MQVIIFVTFQIEGWHRWKEAPLHFAYLGHSHRHMFHFRVECRVDHENRDIEFHELQHEAEKSLWMTYNRANQSQFGLDFNDNSCEMIAHTLLDDLSRGYPGILAVECSEDGENGARVEK